MSKKLTILFIATFILALVFFSSYFVVQEVRGAIGIGNDIDMNNNLIIGLRNSYASGYGTPEPITWDYLKCMEKLCFTSDRTLRASQGLGEFCAYNWCDINDFAWCTENFSPPGYGCFTPETPILMADGKYKPIKDVKEEDWILTKESENSDKMVPAKVTKTFKRTMDSYYRIINHKLEVTDPHPVFVDGSWKQAWTIKLGDKLLDEKGQEVVVESLKLKRAKVEVYNLEIEDYETYFASGFYVHNKPEKGTPPTKQAY